MQSIIHLTTKVLDGHRVEICDPNLPEGQSVEVILYPTVAKPAEVTSVLSVVESLKGHRLFSTPQDVDRYLHEERSSWDQ
jgi:hypothetical protein